VAQIEHYLSDDNLEHDAFLLKHIRRNKMGFVSVKLLTSFKKVSDRCMTSHRQGEGWRGGGGTVAEEVACAHTLALPVIALQYCWFVSSEH
jgi:hypothetical protein